MVNPTAASTVQSVAGGNPEAIARVRLYEGEGGSWSYTDLEGYAAVLECGGVPVMKVIDTDSRSSEFEQELYEGMNYNSSCAHFHFFESDEVVIGLSFGSASEAPPFASAVNRLIPRGGGGGGPPPPTPQAREMAPPTPAPAVPAASPNPPPTAASSSPAMTRTTVQPAPSTSSSTPRGGKSQGGGWKKKGGLFGGITAKFNELISDTKEPEDFVLSGPTGFRHQSHIGWDPDNGFDVKNIPPEWRKLFQAAGVKKSELQDANTAKFIMQTVTEAMAAEEGGAPPPPPGGGPPPPPAGGPPPPPPPPGPPPPGAPPPAAKPASGGGGGGGGVDLMAQIQQGKELKKVEEPDLNKLDEGKQLNLADTLASAMAARRGGVSGTADKDDEDEWDDEWDD